MWDGGDFSGAKIAVITGTRILTYKRDNIPTIPFPGLWDLPGGGREGGEGPLDCALRELEEEFALQLRPPDICHHGCHRARSGAGQTTHFFVADIAASRLTEIRFGSEGERWELAAIPDYLARRDAVPHLQTRVAAWWSARSLSGSGTI